MDGYLIVIPIIIVLVIIFVVRVFYTGKSEGKADNRYNTTNQARQFRNSIDNRNKK